MRRSKFLRKINKVKPNTETILYLMALCQARTDKKSEALELCEQLINDFDNKRAKELKDYLTTPASPLGRSKQEAQVIKEKQEAPQGKEEMPEEAKPSAKNE